MNATDHLSKYGITPTAKTDGKIGLQGVGSLAEPLKSEIIAWAKNHRTKILKELSTDVKNVFTEKDPPWTTEEWEDMIKNQKPYTPRNCKNRKKTFLQLMQ